ncbi:helix-turn-helix domain-containing protein [Lusitaniella coriacea]|uniref:helix-turn-helix domain-containing protein n=1 Tax=Lusitaniella coriacea TaxID=1983105 RepID=UPI003CF381CD
MQSQLTFVPDYSEVLKQRMQALGIVSFRQLSHDSGVSERQLKHLRQGKIAQMRVEALFKLSDSLKMPVEALWQQFSPLGQEQAAPIPPEETLREEYQRLEQKLEQQRKILLEEFQRSSLQVLESWLQQWSAVVAAAQKNPQLPALPLLPLMKPLDLLLQEWQVDAIASVGEELAYDPQWHQLMEGTARSGDKVRVRYAGYCHRGKMLFRARVSPV